MGCKYRKILDGSEKPYCEATDGECQFTVEGSENECPIKDEFKG